MFDAALKTTRLALHAESDFDALVDDLVPRGSRVDHDDIGRREERASVNCALRDFS